MSEDEYLRSIFNDSASVTFDYTFYPQCKDQLNPAYLVEAYCELPDLESMHSTLGGHLGRDKDGVPWGWDADSARIITSY